MNGKAQIVRVRKGADTNWRGSTEYAARSSRKGTSIEWFVLRSVAKRTIFVLLAVLVPSAVRSKRHIH